MRRLDPRPAWWALYLIAAVFLTLVARAETFVEVGVLRTILETARPSPGGAFPAAAGARLRA
jgi:hypothetical protein